MKVLRLVVLSSAAFCASSAALADITLVENGRPRAEIVIVEQAARTVRLAAQELQDDVRTVTGAHLPIVTAPTAGVAQVYVGRSSHTDRLRITAEGLDFGAYRIAVGENWLVLIGNDAEFTPIEPWARNNDQIVSGVAQKKWDEITGAHWGLPNVLIYKDRTSLPGETGLPDAERVPGSKLPRLETWTQDERGSFNAVCGLMYRLGMRWYAPGPVGEVAPKLNTISLPTQDETVRPDFPIRRFNVRWATHGEHMVRWAMRIGLRDPYGIEAAHGMSAMTDNKEVMEAHPEWFSLYGGKRHNDLDEQNNHLCYSNEELIAETVRYVRAQFDQFHVDFADLRKVIFDDADLQIGVFLNLLEDVEAAAAAVAFHGVGRVGDELEFSKDELWDDEYAVEESGLDDIGDAAVDDDGGIEDLELLLGGNLAAKDTS